ncbi:MAG: branched-chain amino acid ABC transporter ATP-binding protein/permease [Armatimonadota bacterium]|nr:branched-chain amino acid ABC transporter ATP-binding protein/permease [Armatimonadota bacterium]MDR7386808.1 branched-chain amino acid ABC transporter ATP-binding protein/permease [Armatimonadota bacterium]MDR7388862.1 branched-chain amino acid ABC transporter ATP-binding protein/permease [Armatimonadota bacterium]MDR7392079.1 branched-chain amino acid ABC transporter ATP-binding protein/permease [Armatimonadota bacterium]MDR7393531.1 branched-chain amino acid ABC transporter ATP-binding pr
MNRPRTLAALVLGGLVLLPAAVQDSFFLNAMVHVFLFGAAAQAWNLVGGYAGQISFGHAAFFGIGAYTTAWLLSRHGLSPWFGIWVGAAVAAAVSLAVGYPTFRLRRHFFALATLALAEIARISFLNWEAVGAAIGLYLPLEYRNRLAYLMWDSKPPYYWTALGVLALATGVVWGVDRHRAGRYLRAVEQDEDAAEMLGIPTRRWKLFAMGLSAALTAVAGAVYALYVLYIDPYNVMASRISLLVVVVALIGGRGTVWGPVLGAPFVVLLNEYTRAWLGGRGTGADFILFGLAVVLVSLYQPRGLIGLLASPSPRPLPAVVGAGRDPQDVPPAGAGGPPVLQVRGMEKAFGGVRAVRGVGLEVRRGEVLGLVGPNGAGKSTLFDCLTGFVRPDAGQAAVDGIHVVGLPPHRVAWAGLARTFQNVRVFPDLSVWDNLLCGTEHRGEGLWEATLREVPPALQEEAGRLLRSFNLWDHRHRPAGELSYGQQKLLSLAMAVLRRPRVVLLDEPAAGVNPVLVDEIGRLVRALNASGLTFVVIEHNMEFVMRICHRVAFMAEGRVVTVGRPDEVRRDPRVLELYYGR